MTPSVSRFHFAAASLCRKQKLGEIWKGVVV
jgi:hypothetical protein